ncbi:MAG: hypothetical protein K6U87_03270 [Firmicutes bacterium]|nr:hypothetical protein [Bacillota bacterium]
MEVTFGDCYRDLVSNGGYKLLASWSASNEVQQYVKQFVHRRLYHFTIEDIEQVLQTIETGHIDNRPLANVKAREAHPVIEDLRPMFPLVCVFHEMIESTNKIPTFSAFHSYLRKDTGLRCYQDFLDALAHIPGSYESKMRALRWRLGNAYNSAFREVYVLIYLKERHKIEVKYHLFADIQLQTDLWFGFNLIRIYVPNAKLLRKRDPKTWAYKFRIHDVQIAHRGFGKIWLPDRNTLDNLAMKLKRC